MLTGFVTFEGIDGSGKTTVSRLVAEKFKSRGIPVALTSEPTTGWLGDAVRRAITEDVGALTETFLFLADRAAHLPELRAHLEKGELVLCDRYADSTYAYQGARLASLMRDPMRFLERTSEPWTLIPDLSLLLRLPPSMAMARIRDRPGKIRFENSTLLTRVAANYDRLATSRRFAVLDATRPVAAVVDEAISLIEKRLTSRRTA